jgi:ubiquitin-hydrolase Zn-finger-containing protein/SnoaL-like polyketide cyclase
MVVDVEERLAELSRRLADGDFAPLRTYLAAEYYRATPGPGEPAACERIADLALALRAAMPDLIAALDDVTIGDDVITARMTLRGTHEHDLWGSPGNGETFEWITPVTVRTIGDRFAVSFDDMPTPQRVGLLRQLHLVNPPDEMHLPPHYPVTTPEFVLKLAFTGEAGDRPCSHLDQIRVTEPATAVCDQCTESGDIWPALRMCLVCGFVGCCDTSKNRHMVGHYQETGHPIMRSIRMDEGWVWCYADDAFFEKAILDRYR